MKAYRVAVIGTNNTYLLTERQKPIIEMAVQKRTERYLKIGDDLVQTSSIRSITVAEVDLDYCPEYFKKAVALEKAEKDPAQKNERFRNLPTRWIIVDEKGEILAENIGRTSWKTLWEKLAKTVKAQEKLIIAKCHYVLNEKTGLREYYTQNVQIATALECRIESENGDVVIVRIYNYGQKQL